MNWVDLFVIIVLLVAIGNGIRRGLFRELISLSAIVIGLIVAINYSDWFSDKISGILTIPLHLMFIVSFVGLLVIVFVLEKLMGIALYKMVSPTSLQKTDKLGGGLVGALKGVFVLGVIFMIFLFMPLFAKLNTNVDESVLAPPITKVIPKLYDYTTLIHPSNPSFVVKVRNILVPFNQNEIEVARKEDEKYIKSTGEAVMDDVERRFGENQPSDSRQKR
ncbi:MAG: hypothetical protein CO189_00535 [candidate division Zixibacteria bacterium CG_4_9_14_3_um_filter_46_8]|nr:MAG: hypothetical protein CO189_00535 [candidate division Zixibacteria bacterium CG_4_9_14_3_um_filter_46_8]